MYMIIGEIALKVGLAIILAMFIHEMGHFLTASILLFKFITFKPQLTFLFGFIPIIRFVWSLPYYKMARFKVKLISIAGFGAEFAAIPILHYYSNIYNFDISYFYFYSSIAAMHLILYPFYSGNFNDFAQL